MHREYIRIAAGADSAVLMIHGIVGTPAHFREFIPLVPKDVSVYNILLDGHGGSVKDFAKTSMAKWQAQIDRVLESIFAKHHRVYILAHSMGTLFAINAAIKHPERVSGLFLLSVPLLPRVTFKTAVAGVCLALGLGKQNELAKAMQADTAIRLERNLFKYLGWVPRYLELFSLISKTKKQLGAISVPGVCFQVRRDELVRPGAERLMRKHTKLCCRVLENSGHFAYSSEDMQLLKNVFSQQMSYIKEDNHVQGNSQSKAEN